MQNHGSVRLMGLGSHWFLPFMRKLPQFVVQRGPPHDLSQSVKIELDFAGFHEVLRHLSKNSFLVPSPRVQLGAPGKMLF